MDQDRLRRVEALYHEALARPADARGAFLADACGNDESLRREVEALVAHAASNGKFLKTPLLVPRPQLTPGQVLGRYRIVDHLGAGGMGEVYRARDTRLQRDVALKVLPHHLSTDPDRRMRLEREARAVSALVHTHICTLHDIGQDDGRDFLVMELVEGTSLAQRLSKGPLPVAEALARAIEIADALSVAHRRGIVHRDLKPGNVMLTKDGAKLLDFGLAQFVGPAGAAEALTEKGTILGTLPYMAPEQLEGKPVDGRTDIFAFGTLLFEMLTGNRAFEGASQAALIGAILKSDLPAPSSLTPGVPKSLDRLVGKCVQKDPEERWQDARDLRDGLKWIGDSGSQNDAARQTGRRFGLWGYALSAVAVLVAISGAAYLGSFRGHTEPGASRRFPVALPPDAPLAAPAMVWAGEPIDKLALAISPDGNRLVYVARVGNQTALYQVDLANGGSKPLAGTEGASTPFFSPDGESIAFFAQKQLKRVSLAGGTPTPLANVTFPCGGVWGPGDVIYCAFSENGIQKVPAGGGLSKLVVDEAVNTPAFIGPADELLTTIAGRKTVWTRNGRIQGSVLENGFAARYIAQTGHIVYAQPGRLLAVPFDRARMTVSGQPVTIADGVRTGHYGTAQFSISEEGTLVYVSGSHQGTASFVWVDRAGTDRDAGLPEATDGYFSVSADGARLATSEPNPDGGDELWIHDLRRVGVKRRVPGAAKTGQSVAIRFLKWMPDKHHVVFTRGDAPNYELVVVDADSGTDPTILWTSDHYWLYPMSFSPDGTSMTAFSGKGQAYVLRMRTEDGSIPSHVDPQPILKGQDAHYPQFSPDGLAIVYQGRESRSSEVYVMPYQATGRRCQVSDGGGSDPSWASKGREIVYKRGLEVWAVEITSVPDCNFGRPHFLFRGDYPSRPGFDYDGRYEGQELLMLKKSDIFQTAGSVNVITNFFDWLRLRVPPSR